MPGSFSTSAGDAAARQETLNRLATAPTATGTAVALERSHV